jgi:hypothetical protein
MVFRWTKVYFDWNPNNELGTSTYLFWKTDYQNLASPNEAAFSKLDFKKTNPDLYYYIDKGRLFRIP